MQQISEYIFEKLKINKDSKLSSTIKAGDKIGIFTLTHRSKTDKTLDLTIHNPFTVENITDKKIEYKADSGKLIDDIYIHTNSCGYCQENEDNYYQKDYARTIYLNKSDSIEFLNKLLKRNIDNKDVIKEYFDHIDIFDLNMEIRICDLSGSCLLTIKTKGIKEFINRYENA